MAPAYIAFVWADRLFSDTSEPALEPGEGGYTSLVECADDLESRAEEAGEAAEECLANAEDDDAAALCGDAAQTEQVSMSADNRRLVKYFESKYDCSGLCKSNLFYWMKSIDEGMPKSPCISALWVQVGELCVQLGTPPLLGAILLFFALILNYPLCAYDHQKWLEQ